MAAVTVLKTVGNNEDDEAWLYGDAENKEPGPPGTEQVQLTAPSDQPGGEPSQDADDDDSDDDDDVQVTIGDIKAFPMNNAAAGLYKPPATYQKQPVVAGPKIGTTTQAVKGVDVEAEGTINGVGVYEFSLDSLLEEEKPWRKPGADITDYFNYGFNEDTWRKYCQKQNRLRAENGGTIPRTYTTGMTNTVVKVESIGSGYTDNSRYIQPKPTPNVAPIGTIAVLGSTTASRRPMEEQINEMEQQMGGAPDEMKPGMPPPGMPPPGMNMPPPNYNLPPPGMPPIPTFPPAVPPPGMGVPPPGMFAQPPPVPILKKKKLKTTLDSFLKDVQWIKTAAANVKETNRIKLTDITSSGSGNVTEENTVEREEDDEYDDHGSRGESNGAGFQVCSIIRGQAFFPPHQPMPPNANFGERPPFSYENAPSHPAYPESSGDKPAWESRDRDRDRDSYRDRDRDRDRERDREGGEDYSRSRDYSSSRDYDRGDYYSRSSDRSRSDRDRSRSRERDRRHRDRDRDRDDKKSKSRKVKDEPDDSDYYKSSSSSKHKKSKRSKRDKDDDREGSDREDK